MKTQLLVETLTPEESNVISEARVDGKDLYITGIFAQAELKNRNGRVYPLSEMSSAIQRLNESMKQTNSILGHLNHLNSLQIDPEKVSHAITELKMVGNNVMGKAKLLDTPMGRIAKTIIESNYKLGLSSVSSGELYESSDYPDSQVVKNMSMITVDLVVNPSGQNCFVQDTLYESLDDSVKGRKILTLAEEIHESANAQKYLVKEIKSFFESLRK